MCLAKIYINTVGSGGLLHLWLAPYQENPGIFCTAHAISPKPSFGPAAMHRAAKNPTAQTYELMMVQQMRNENFTKKVRMQSPRKAPAMMVVMAPRYGCPSS